MNNKIILESMALDLKRVALGSYSNSTKMAERFLQEVYKRKTELNTNELPDPVNTLLVHMTDQLKVSDINRLADYALMYSTLLLSYSKQL